MSSPAPTSASPAAAFPAADSEAALPPRVRAVRGAAIVIGIALLAAIIEATFGSMAPRPGVPGTPWVRAMVVTLPSWLVTAALVPAILALSRRFPIRGRRWRSGLAVHLLGVTAFVPIHIALSLLLLRTVEPIRPSFAIVFFSLLRIYSLAEVLIFASVVGAWHAVHFHRESLQKERDAAALRIDLTRARLEALRLQLHPHFLFNTLHTIGQLAEAGRTETLVRTVENLGDLLRAALDGDLVDDIPLERELELLARYLEILRVRHADRLTIQWEVEDAVRDALVPPLLLQPLVENAVIHGIQARSGPGTITIRAREDARALRLEVEDAGTGPSVRPPRPNGKGVGLANTRERLTYRYGSRCRLDYHAPEGGDTRVTVILPLEREATPAPVARE